MRLSGLYQRAVHTAVGHTAAEPVGDVGVRGNPTVKPTLPLSHENVRLDTGMIV